MSLRRIALCAAAFLACHVAVPEPPPAPPSSEADAAWLLTGDDHPLYQDVARRYLDAEPDIRRLLRVSRSLRTDRLDTRTLIQFAAVAEIAGDLEEAERLTRAASRSRDADSTLRLTHARLLYDLGRDQDALEVLATLAEADTDPAIRASAGVLSALIMLDSGQERPGLAALELAAEDPSTPAVQLQALLALYAYHRGGDEEAARRYSRRLAQIAPESLEAVMTRPDSAVSQLMSPRTVFRILAPRSAVTSTQQPPPDLPSPTPVAAIPSPTPVEQGPKEPVMVQTGSFRVRENAEYMIADLQRAGFLAAVRQVSVKDQTYFRVLIQGSVSPEKAAEILLRLKDAGFEGYLVDP